VPKPLPYPQTVSISFFRRLTLLSFFPPPTSCFVLSKYTAPDTFLLVRNSPVFRPFFCGLQRSVRREDYSFHVPTLFDSLFSMVCVPVVTNFLLPRTSTNGTPNCLTSDIPLLNFCVGSSWCFDFLPDTRIQSHSFSFPACSPHEIQ